MAVSADWRFAKSGSAAPRPVNGRTGDLDGIQELLREQLEMVKRAFDANISMSRQLRQFESERSFERIASHSRTRTPTMTPVRTPPPAASMDPRMQTPPVSFAMSGRTPSPASAPQQPVPLISALSSGRRRETPQAVTPRWKDPEAPLTARSSVMSNTSDGFGEPMLSAREPLLSARSGPSRRQHEEDEEEMHLQRRRPERKLEAEFQEDITPASKPRTIFPDREAVKAFVKSTLTKEEYDVEDFYRSEGCAQALARSEYFKNITLLVILANTLWIAYDADNNNADIILHAEWQFQLAENLFCSYFCFEILTRFAAFGSKRSCLKDGWFIFDSLLVGLMVWETWVCSAVFLVVGSSNDSDLAHSSVLRALRLFRLLRSGRILRLLRSFPELMILVQAMKAAMRSVCGTLSLMVILVYVFAIVLTQISRGLPKGMEGFETVPQAMNTLMKTGIFPDQQALLDQMASTNMICYLVFVLYVSIGTLALMNLLIGVLCEVVADTSRSEKEVLLAHDMKQQLLSVCKMLDKDESGTICATEFRNIAFNSIACKILHELGVDVQTLVDAAELIYAEYDELTFDDFVDVGLRYRGDLQATLKDVVEIRKAVIRESQILSQCLTRCGNGLGGRF